MLGAEALSINSEEKCHIRLFPLSNDASIILRYKQDAMQPSRHTFHPLPRYESKYVTVILAIVDFIGKRRDTRPPTFDTLTPPSLPGTVSAYELH